LRLQRPALAEGLGRLLLNWRLARRFQRVPPGKVGRSYGLLSHWRQDRERRLDCRVIALLVV
jgi:hypothetical protein